MPVNFKNIPDSLRVPLFYAEVDPSHANSATPALRALLIGGKLAAGTGPANVPDISLGPDDARTKFGLGSILAQMVDVYRQNDRFGELWCLPVSDDGAAVAAAGELTFTGPATAAGTLNLYIAGRPVPVAVSAGMTAAQLATAVVAKIVTLTDLPVTAAVDGVDTHVVNVTAKNKGETGNDIDLRLNYRGPAGGETTPAGIACVITAMAAGATNPSLAAALGNIGDEPFEFIAMPYTDAASLAALKAFLADSNGRWSWSSQIYGHLFIAYRDDLAGLTAWGQTQNDPHASALGLHGVPTPAWEVAAALAAVAAVSVRADAAQPIRELVLQGVLPPALEDRFNLSERNTLLFDGVSTFKVVGGAVVLEKLITTYQTNSFGQADDSFLDAETLFTLAAVLRRLSAVATTKYARKKLAANGTFIPAGANVVTPNMIKADIIAEYRSMEGDLVQDGEAFQDGLIVEIDADNPRRVNVLWPGTLISRLDILALLAQFRLAA
jgi:phage tail sheath gpL-like